MKTTMQEYPLSQLLEEYEWPFTVCKATCPGGLYFEIQGITENGEAKGERYKNGVYHSDCTFPTSSLFCLYGYNKKKNPNNLDLDKSHYIKGKTKLIIQKKDGKCEAVFDKFDTYNGRELIWVTINGKTKRYFFPQNSRVFNANNHHEIYQKELETSKRSYSINEMFSNWYKTSSTEKRTYTDAEREDNTKIIAEAKIRKISRLVHFTNVANLNNIINYGLLPRTELDRRGISYTYNDKERLDGCSNAISISITSPNYQMFYKLRKESSAVWAVLILDAEKVLGLDCAFCKINAADKLMRSKKYISRKKDYLSFVGMFYDKELRKKLGLSECQPTDPQAEILVFDKIPISAIKGIVFDNKRLRQQYADILQSRGIECSLDNNYYFAPRKDWEYWKHRKEGIYYGY